MAPCVEPPLIQVAIGIVCNQQHQFLVSLRPHHKELPDFWEFPGGKVEVGEASAQALQRELWEEVGITVQKARPFLQQSCIYPATEQKPEKNILLSSWWIEEFTGIAYGREGQIIAWVSRAELETLPMLPANSLLITALTQPDRCPGIHDGTPLTY